MKYFFFIIISIANSINVFAQDSYILQSQNIKILGTSTVHDWVIDCVNATASGMFVRESNKLKEIKSMMVEIPVKELKSEKKNKTMDEKMDDALKIETCPNITFKFKQITSYPSETNGFLLSAIGAITIAGVTKEETLSVATKVNNNGTIYFSGEKKLLMSDYKIKPPKAMLGMLTTGNEVTIKYEFTMKQN